MTDQNIDLELKKNSIKNRHEALPDKALDGLPVIDWEKMDIPPAYIPQPEDMTSYQKKLTDNAMLPQADIVVMTWTIAEWAALNHVFCDYDIHMPVNDVSRRDWRKPWVNYMRDYYTILQYMVNVKRSYQGGAPSLESQAWGQYRMVKIGGLKVLLIKSGMHLAQDGSDLPLLRFTEKICSESKPELLLSIGTAGGVRNEDALGSALICNQAVFYLLEEFKNAPFNLKIVKSDWTPQNRFISTAQKQILQVPGFPVLPVSPQYPQDARIEPDSPDSKIKIVLNQPIVTTDCFLFGTTTHKNGLSPELGCIVEMDDAVVGMICEEKKVPFGFIRNVSDPVINGDLPEKIQEAWAAYIYKEHGIYTSFNGALACWAVIAGEAAKKNQDI